MGDINWWLFEIIVQGTVHGIFRNRIKMVIFGAETTLLFEKNKNRNKYVLFIGFAAEDHDD